MKTCTLCREEKDSAAFHNNNTKKDGLSNVCRDCSRATTKSYYRRNTAKHKLIVKLRNKATRDALRAMTNKIKSDSGCVICGEKELVTLDFHHKDRKTKEATIADMVANCPARDRLLREVEKCIVVCANCHRKIEAGIIKI